MIQPVPVALIEVSGVEHGLRERKKIRTRVAIEDAALALFEQHGYEATTVEDIAALAEVSTTTFLRCFRASSPEVRQLVETPARGRGADVRRLVTGTDAHGRSCVVEDVEVGPAIEMPGFMRHVIYESDQAPPPPRPAGHGDYFPMGIDPGHVLWYLTTLEPDTGLEVPFHHTDTVDIGLLLDGSIELILDDGAHLLRAGDCFVVHGNDHSWRVGPDGCRICSASIGTPSESVPTDEGV